MRMWCEHVCALALVLATTTSATTTSATTTSATTTSATTYSATTNIMLQHNLAWVGFPLTSPLVFIIVCLY